MPFRSTLDFYNEFKTSKIADGLDLDFIPKLTTFKTITKDKKQQLPCELRYLRCKGAHASCEICVNAAKLLENRSKRLDHQGKTTEHDYFD